MKVVHVALLAAALSAGCTAPTTARPWEGSTGDLGWSNDDLAPLSLLRRGPALTAALRRAERARPGQDLLAALLRAAEAQAFLNQPTEGRAIQAKVAPSGDGKLRVTFSEMADRKIRVHIDFAPPNDGSPEWALESLWAQVGAAAEVEAFACPYTPRVSGTTPAAARCAEQHPQLGEWVVCMGDKPNRRCWRQAPRQRERAQQTKRPWVKAVTFKGAGCQDPGARSSPLTAESEGFSLVFDNYQVFQESTGAAQREAASEQRCTITLQLARSVGDWCVDAELIHRAYASLSPGAIAKYEVTYAIQGGQPRPEASVWKGPHESNPRIEHGVRGRVPGSEIRIETAMKITGEGEGHFVLDQVDAGIVGHVRFVPAKEDGTCG